MATQREAEALTGLKVGGISALALLGRGFTIYLDASANALDTLYVSGGQRGVDLRLKVADLIAVTAATVIEATEGEGNAKSAEDAKNAKKNDKGSVS